MNIYSVYKAENLINGKVYIGKSNNFDKRIISHKSESKKATSKLFYKAIKKYGWENFKWEILYQSKEESHIYEMETSFIAEYNSYYLEKNSMGYNMTRGGDGISSETAKNSILEQKQNKVYWEIRKQVGEKLIKEKTHNFIGGQIQRNRINNGTHNFLDKCEQKRKALKRVSKGTHNFLTQTHKENNRKKCNEIFICPYCKKTGKRLSMFRWHFNNCKENLCQ